MIVLSKENNAVHFVDENKVFYRLSSTNFGWRLQGGKDVDLFNNKGASQMLASFMNEDLVENKKQLKYIEQNNQLSILEESGTRAVLALDEKFSIKFLSKNNDVVIDLIDFNYDSGNAVIKGALNSIEAIFGGGERFDKINKRGTCFELYSSDGWNNSNTTYVVIPTFLTTRGGGMFFNHNEYAKVDFGCDCENEWVYTVNSGALDAYFYCTGNMLDVLNGYTSLSGKADMPKPWMQGIHICRYGPDFWCFDKDKSCANIEDFEDYKNLYVSEDGVNFEKYTDLSNDAKFNANRFYFFNDELGKYELKYLKNDAGKVYPKGRKGSPSGDSCKTIVTNFMNAGMKPDAISMEGRGWVRCFFDNEESRLNKTDLIKSVKWLHSLGLKALVYIRVGDVNEETIGYKDEYVVHADVEITDENGCKEVIKNTSAIPWILGTGENPDVGKRKGVMRTANYLDITNEEAVNWYFDTLWGEMIDIGIDGVKIDFCECMPDGDKQIGSTKTHYYWKNPSKFVIGTEHHAYAPYYISLFYKKMNELKTQKGLKDGFMVFSRGGGIGSQRNPYLWAGDQARFYEKLKDQLFAVVNCGLSGVPFMSFDIAGYTYGKRNYYSIGKENESAIFARGIEFSAFLTQMQTHGDVRHAYDMTEEVQEIYRNFTRLHNEFIPYIQKLSKIATETGLPPIRHLVLQYPFDSQVYNIEDQFMLGDALLVAPIWTENTFEKEVYLPNGEWLELLTGQIVNGGKTVVAKANIGQIPVYLNINSSDSNDLQIIFHGENWLKIKNFK